MRPGGGTGFEEQIPMTLAHMVREAAGKKMVDEDGHEDFLQLSPGLGQAELDDLEKAIPCPLPAEVRELLELTRGFENGPLEEVQFWGLPGFGLDELFPCPLPIAHDGYGNHWVVDLTSTSSDWGPIFYTCHDPPVIVYQCPDLETFIRELLRFANPPHASTLDDVHEDAAFTIWADNPGAITWEAGCNSQDPVLQNFADELNENFLIFDLRQAQVGDGFSWGRYGPDTVCRRHKEERLFAYEVKQKLSLLKRLFGWLTPQTQDP